MAKIEVVEQEKVKKRTEGKFLGSVAFWVSEFLVIGIVIGIVIKVFIEGLLDSNLVAQLLFFQGTIFTVSWGAKASSNFAKKK